MEDSKFKQNLEVVGSVGLALGYIALFATLIWGLFTPGSPATIFGYEFVGFSKFFLNLAGLFLLGLIPFGFLVRAIYRALRDGAPAGRT
ncbi:hypothetical protein [Microbulbifer pacificus]|uniref:hypothetical protein n=1 Tax=Microbulbifer pacificus TaxID=407164 RepID=UPI000CF57C22|nr:hypothetical protein [Microbulbifer pacificus]